MNKQLSSFPVEQLTKVRSLTSSQLVSGLKQKRNFENELLSEIVIYIFEVDRRKLYLNYNCTSLFDFLVRELGYCNASAQRRIDAARMLTQNPEVAEKLKTGELNLTQVSIVAQGLKQAKREAAAAGEKFTSSAEVKAKLLESVKAQPKDKAQQIVAQALNLEVKAYEKKVVQRDESVRLEIVLSKEEAELLKEVKDLLSHSMPGANSKEVIVEALRELKRKKDPAAIKRNYSRAIKLTPKINQSTSAAEVRRSVFRKDKCCQWKFSNGQLCGSTFQLQVDHKKSKWLGGSGDRANLQLLCSAHNKLKYQKEVGLM